jgi:hypothetical protein
MTAQLQARPAGPILGAAKPIVYLAGRYSRREELAGYAEGLIALGLFRCEARWLVEPHDWDGTAEGEGLKLAQRYALDDLEDLGRAHAVVVFTEEAGAYRRGGSLVEYGLALAMQKHVVVVGPAPNVFITLPMVVRYADWAAALAHLIEWKDAVERAVLRKRLELP